MRWQCRKTVWSDHSDGSTEKKGNQLLCAKSSLCNAAATRCGALPLRKNDASERKERKRLNAHRVLQGGAHNFTSLSKSSKPLIQSVNSTLSYRKSCHLVRGTPWSTAWIKKNAQKPLPPNGSPPPPNNFVLISVFHNSSRGQKGGFVKVQNAGTCNVRCPTMEPFFVKKLPRFRGFFPWNFGVPSDISPNLTKFWSSFDLFWLVLTHSQGRPDLFSLIPTYRRADLTYFHLFRPISFHSKAPWTGHLSNAKASVNRFTRPRRTASRHCISLGTLIFFFLLVTSGWPRFGSVTVRAHTKPEGPKSWKIQSRLKFSIFKLDIFNLDLQNSPQKIGGWCVARLKFSISLENFNLDLQNSPQKIGGWWVARLKISISLENFKILNFFKIWALGEGVMQPHASFSTNGRATTATQNDIWCNI